jgi:hypothetical protein
MFVGLPVMADTVSIPTIQADDFARRFALRGGSLMWLLGAGASASAGVPTAGNMTWEFKQKLYVSQRRVDPRAIADLSNPAVRARLQSHVDASSGFPSAGAPDEYAALFEAAYPAEADRRTYIDSKMAGASPSYGHVALATLMRSSHTRLVWTTNFDPVLADAAASVFGSTANLATVALDAPDLASQLIDDERWPLEIKLHGDFRSRRLKNTPDELRHQDARLRRILVDCCRRFGLIVVGYSGRDDSIMAALDEVLDHEGGFPKGLFWLHRGGSSPLPRVAALMERASSKGIEAALVGVENFDEALRDLIRLIEGLDTTALDQFAQSRQRWTSVPVPTGRRTWPAIRLNAIPLTESPTVCRRVDCSIGGYSEVQQAVHDAGVEILCSRVKAGVLAFGEDADVRAAFDPYGITNFDLHTIELHRLRYDSGERGLLRDALSRAIARERALHYVRRRSTDLLRPNDTEGAMWGRLKSIVGSLSGAVDGQPELAWFEGVGTRLDWADDRVWLLIEPRTVFEGLTDANKAAASDFARERTVKRYNRQLNDLVGFWAELIAGSGDELRAMTIDSGVGASFRMSNQTAFSRRCHA